MDPRESDPTGAFSGGGAARLEGTARPGDRPAQVNDREPGTDEGEPAPAAAPATDGDERGRVVGGVAATSEIADPRAQADAGIQGDGTPQRR